MLNERSCGSCFIRRLFRGRRYRHAWRKCAKVRGYPVGYGDELLATAPLTPPDFGNSPYSSLSAFAGNPLLIDLHQLATEGDLPLEVYGGRFPEERVDYGGVSEFKLGLLHQAAATFLAAEKSSRTEEFWHFCDTTPGCTILRSSWPLNSVTRERAGINAREAALLTSEAYEKASRELGPEIGIQKYLQWQFSRQWQSLRAYAAAGCVVHRRYPIFVPMIRLMSGET